jgi:hypothetical protein
MRADKTSTSCQLSSKGPFPEPLDWFARVPTCGHVSSRCHARDSFPSRDFIPIHSALPAPRRLLPPCRSSRSLAGVPAATFETSTSRLRSVDRSRSSFSLARFPSSGFSSSRFSPSLRGPGYPGHPSLAFSLAI